MCEYYCVSNFSVVLMFQLQSIILPDKDTSLCDMDIFNGYLVLFFTKKGLPLLCSLNLPMQIDFKVYELQFYQHLLFTTELKGLHHHISSSLPLQHLSHLILMNMPGEIHKRQRILQYDNTKEVNAAFPFMIPSCTHTLLPGCML